MIISFNFKQIIKQVQILTDKTLQLEKINQSLAPGETKFFRQNFIFKHGGNLFCQHPGILPLKKISCNAINNYLGLPSVVRSNNRLACRHAFKRNQAKCLKMITGENYNIRAGISYSFLIIVKPT